MSLQSTGMSSPWRTENSLAYNTPHHPLQITTDSLFHALSEIGKCCLRALQTPSRLLPWKANNPSRVTYTSHVSWWRHQMIAFPALLAFCVGNSPVTGEFPSQRPVTRSCDVSFHLRLNQHLSKQWRRRWFEAPLRSLWRHCNDICTGLHQGLTLLLPSRDEHVPQDANAHPASLPEPDWHFNQKKKKKIMMTVIKMKMMMITMVTMIMMMPWP